MAEPSTPNESSVVTLADPVIPVDPERLVRLLGAELARIHDADSTGLPGLDLAAVAQRIATHVAEDSEPLTDGAFRGQSRAHLLAAAQTAIDDLADDLDYRVPIRFPVDLSGYRMSSDGSMTLAAATHAGDRHLELAAVAVGLADRFGPAVVAPFIDAYGMANVDPRRLDAAQLLLAAGSEALHCAADQ